MSYEELGIRLRTDGGVETTKGINLVGTALDSLAGKADAAVDGLGAVVPSAEAVTRALNPMTIAIGAAVVGAGALTAAYIFGRREQEGYAQGIVMTGNAAGTTAGQVADMARAIADPAFGENKASVALTALINSAAVGKNDLEQFALTAVRMERLTGQAIDKTVATFEKLARDPVKASAALNEKTNFLTVAVYEQITALVKQGRETDAAALAQRTYADAMDSRLKVLEGRLGFFERAANSAEGAWSKFKNSLLDIGRDDTVTQQIAKIDAQLTALDTRKSDNPRNAALRREALVERRAVLEEARRLEDSVAQNQAGNARGVRDAIATKPEKKGGGREPADHYRTLNDQIERRLALAQGELDAGEKLTGSERTRIELEQTISEKQQSIGIVAAEVARQRAADIVNILRLTEQQTDANAKQAALDKQFQQERQQATQAAERELATLQQQRDTLAQETAEIGLNAAAVVARRRAVMDAAIADKEAQLARISGLPAYTEEAAALERQIVLLRSIRDLQGTKAAAKAREDEAKDNERRTDAIAESIFDGITNGFRNGQSVSDIFLRELKAQFARQVLSVPVRLMAEGTNQAISGLLGLFKGLGGGGFGTGAAYGNMDYGQFFHGGGIAGGSPTYARAMPASVWAGATKYHGGGLAGDEVPAVLKRKEGVFTEEQMKALAPVDGARSAGNTIVFSPTISIDSRTDRAEVYALTMRAIEASKSSFMDEQERRLR